MNQPAHQTDLLATATTPDKVGVEGLEAKWGLVWENDGVYRFRRDVDKQQVYSIDTPPPPLPAHSTSDTCLVTPTPT